MRIFVILFLIVGLANGQVRFGSSSSSSSSSRRTSSSSSNRRNNAAPSSKAGTYFFLYLANVRRDYAVHTSFLEDLVSCVRT